CRRWAGLRPAGDPGGTLWPGDHARAGPERRNERAGPEPRRTGNGGQHDLAQRAEDFRAGGAEVNRTNGPRGHSGKGAFMSEPDRQPAAKPGSSRALRVVIVDDHPAMRLSLRFALLSAADIEVVGEATDGEEMLQVCENLHPDVVILDLRLPERLSGAEAI